jgi:recombination protein RecT
MNTKTALAAPATQKLITLRGYLEARKANLLAASARVIAPERLVKLTLVAASRNPQLLQCSPESIYTSLMDASQLDLEPFTGLNYSYIIPYHNGKTGQKEAKFIPSYRGLMELARRSGQIKSIDADIVYENDEWKVEKGLNPKLIHVPNFKAKDRGDPILVYAIARFKDDGYQFVVMTMDQIDKVRKSSKASNSGPWVDWWDQMALKTCLKALLKLCPMSTELAAVVAKDNIADHGDTLNVDFIDEHEHLEIDDLKELKAESKADELVERLVGPQ